MSVLEPSQIDPQSQLLFLLGGMSTKLDAVVVAQATAALEASAFREGHALLAAKVAVLEANVAPRAPWYVVVPGLGSVAAIILSVWTLFHP